jgi:protein SCO1/2
MHARFSLATILLGCAAAIFAARPVCAIEDPARDLGDVGVRTVLGSQVDFSIPLIDNTGKKSSLRELSGGTTPLVLVPAYYHCPRLCGLVLGGVAKVAGQLDLKLGKEYRIGAVSFDPADDPSSARDRQKQVLSEVAADHLPAGMDSAEYWPFFTGAERDVKNLFDQVGYKYKRDGDEFAHTAAIFVLTPEGKISQYFTGIEFQPFDVRLALVEASHGKIGSTLDHVLLYCFRFDPTKGKYVWVAFNIMRVGATATLLLLVSLIYILWRRDRAKNGGASLSPKEG